MTSSTGPRDRHFPTEAVLLDNSALSRFWKCGALTVLKNTVRLVLADQVSREFKKQGRTERAALDDLQATVVAVRLGSAEYAHFSRIRGDVASTRDLGEDESIAVALAARDRGVVLPLAIYDGHAAGDARAEGVVVLDFLDTLACLVACGVLTDVDADTLAARAAGVDGWRAPPGFVGVGPEIESRHARIVEAVRAA